MAYAIAVDLGASHVRVALVGKKILKRIEQATDVKSKGALVVQIISLIDSLQVNLKEVKGICICAAGPIDSSKRILINPPNIPLRDISFAALRKKFRKPVYLLNDSNAAVLGEKVFGSGRRHENLIYITLSTGIGGGIIANERLILGKTGSGAEVGHIVIDKDSRLRCSCGLTGHWEAFGGGASMPRAFRAWSKEKGLKGVKIKSAEQFFQAAKRGNKSALAFVRELGRINAAAIASLVHIFDPALITIGGKVALKNSSLVLKPIKKHIKEYVFTRVPKIILTPLGEDVVLYGGAAVVFNPQMIKK